MVEGHRRAFLEAGGQRFETVEAVFDGCHVDWCGAVLISIDGIGSGVDPRFRGRGEVMRGCGCAVAGLRLPLLLQVVGSRVGGC